MKRFFAKFSSVIGVMALAFYPIAVNATIPGDTSSIYYAGGDPAHNIYTINGQVCKIVNCLTVGTSSDWYNYTSTSATQVGDTGAAQTLVVSPGDTLTFKGTVSFYDEEIYQRNPIFKVAGTNMGYMENFDYFGTGKEDVDGDGKDYVYNPADQSFILAGGLDGNDPAQVGAVTAKVKPDAPAGSVVTVSFFLDDPDEELIGFNPFGTARAADDYLRSGIRIQVASPGTTLPRTGGTPKINLVNLYGAIAAAVSLVTLGVFIGRKKAVKIKR